MKKFIPLSLALLIAGCSGLKRNPARSPSPDLHSATESPLTDEEIFEKTAVVVTPPAAENTHVLAEARADDVVITQAVGNEIDEELSPTPEEQIPYARDFLLQKKTKRTKFWIEYFTQKQRERFQRFINNGEEYRHHIEEIFVQNGLPKELYFVGLIESGFYLTAKSHAAAVGPWQFMPGTGKQFGLRVSSDIDERQDLFKATHAAAKYFKNLHNIFSSWELALASYNAGEYGIIRRILKHGSRDYYKLSRDKLLPDETINYVPKVLAAMHVVNNAEKYGFTIPKKAHHLFDRTELKPIKKNIPLNVIANRLNVDLNLLKKLNPELRRSATPRHLAGTYYLRVPKTQYNYRLIELEGDRDIVAKMSRPESRKEIHRRTANVEVVAPVTQKPSRHKVLRGETLFSIARKFKLTPKALAQANNFKNWNTNVKVGQVLALSKMEARTTNSLKTVARAPVTKIRNTNRPIIYKVTSGDNLTDLARIFNITASKIRTANKLKRGSLMVGQKIVLPSTNKGIYTVKRGDHLTKVARELNQPVEALVKLNSLKRGQIYPGQKIIVDVE